MPEGLTDSEPSIGSIYLEIRGVAATANLAMMDSERPAYGQSC
jgi:hypothetical protein